MTTDELTNQLKEYSDIDQYISETDDMLSRHREKTLRDKEKG